MEYPSQNKSLRRLVRLVVRAAKSAQTGAEVFTAMKLFLWGGFVLLPARSFAGTAYVGLRGFAPEYLHGFYAFAVGGTLIALCDRSSLKAWRVRRIALFLAIVAWLQVAIGFGVVRIWSTATLSYSLDAFVAVVAFHHVAKRRPKRVN